MHFARLCGISALVLFCVPQTQAQTQPDPKSSKSQFEQEVISAVQAIPFGSFEMKGAGAADGAESIQTESALSAPSADAARASEQEKAVEYLTKLALPGRAIGHGSVTTFALGDLESGDDLSSLDRAKLAIQKALKQQAKAQFCYLCPTEGGEEKPRCDMPNGKKLQGCHARVDTDALRALVGGQDGPLNSPLNEPAGWERYASGLPSGFTFFGQFIDHDVTGTLISLLQINQTAQLVVDVLFKERTISDDVKNSLIALINAMLPQNAGDGVGTGNDETTDEALRRLSGLSDAEIEMAVETLSAAVNKHISGSGRSADLDLDSVYGDVDEYADIDTNMIAKALYDDDATDADGDGVPDRKGYFHVRHIMSNEAPDHTAIDGFDYRRNSTDTAFVGDPRNDENKVIAQMHALFLVMHNTCMEALKPAEDNERAFNKCRRYVPQVYQAIVATDYLPRILSYSTLDMYGIDPKAATLPLKDAVDGESLRLFKCEESKPRRLPHEFTVAAFRLGHSQLRNGYRLQRVLRNDQGELLGGEPRRLFEDRKGDGAVVPDLSGGESLGRQDVIDWALFFDLGENMSSQVARPIDMSIAETLFRMPVKALPPVPVASTADASKLINVTDSPSEQNLARRNVLRANKPSHQFSGAASLATAETFVCAMENASILVNEGGSGAGCTADPRQSDRVDKVYDVLAKRMRRNAIRSDSLHGGFPLWLYVIGENEANSDPDDDGKRQRLGPVGSLLVGDVLYGLMGCGGISALENLPSATGWDPIDKVATEKAYGMDDMIGYLETHGYVDLPKAEYDKRKASLPAGQEPRLTLFTPVSFK